MGLHSKIGVGIVVGVFVLSLSFLTYQFDLFAQVFPRNPEVDRSKLAPSNSK